MSHSEDHDLDAQLEARLSFLMTDALQRALAALEAAGAIDPARLRAHFAGPGSQYYDVVAQQVALAAQGGVHAIRQLFEQHASEASSSEEEEAIEAESDVPDQLAPQPMPFPFTEEEWARVRQMALEIVNAVSSQDDVLIASTFSELREVLNELQSQYGPHPMLLETEADFTDDPGERVALYEQARQTALEHGWATYSIRLSLARVLLEDLSDVDYARRELQAIAGERSLLDEQERTEWRQLKKLCDASLEL